jgi:N-acetyl-gamma-glutamyl-phosphate reductase/acetylglutamate kinase
MELEGVIPDYVQGICVTSEYLLPSNLRTSVTNAWLNAKYLETVRRAFLRESPKLVAALEKLGMRTRPITSGVCTADYLDEDECGLVGRITRIDKRPLEAASAPARSRSSRRTPNRRRAKS